MRALFCVAVLFLTIVPCRSETRTPASPVTIVYRFDGPTTDLILHGIKDEIQLLLGPAALRPEWQNRAELESFDSFENLIVVDFHGRCRTGPDEAVSNDGQPLGRTRVVDGSVLPFIEIDCARVQVSLRSVLSRGNQNSDPALGRALARVLAHELYHVLAGTTAHSRTGIAKPSLSVYDLLSTRLEFAPADIDRMKFPFERISSVRAARQELRFIP